MTEPSSPAPSPPAPTPLGLLGMAMVYPTVLTWVYFVALADAPAAWQQATYTIGKVAQFALPVSWLWLVRRNRPHRPQWSSRGMALGILFGLAVVGAMLGLYVALSSTQLLAEASVAIREKIRGLQIEAPPRYAAVGIFYALGHSGLEEYYWRWFVFGQLRLHWSWRVALVVSSLAFMAHHIVLLAHYFGWTEPMAYLLAGSVAVGGLFWDWLYQRTGQLWSAWISHMIVDAGIFALGYFILIS